MTDKNINNQFLRSITGPEFENVTTGERSREPLLIIGEGINFEHDAVNRSHTISITAESFAPIVTASIDAITDQITALSNSVAADILQVDDDINDVYDEIDAISGSIATDVININSSITNINSAKNHFTGSQDGIIMMNTSVPTFISNTNTASGSVVTLTIPTAQFGGDTLVRFNAGFHLRDDTTNEFYFVKDISGLYAVQEDALLNTIEGLQYSSGAAETFADIEASSGLAFSLNVATGSNYKTCIAVSVSKIQI